MPRHLAIIPARGGSKGVPGKNARLLGDKPLIVWTITAALEAECFEAIAVTTDDQQIATIAEKFGIPVPELRPAELAKDETPMLDVIRYMIDKHPGYDSITLLQPTCPFRTKEEIRIGVTAFEKGNYDSLLSVVEVPDKFNPHWVFNERNGKLRLFSGDKQPISRRQDLPKAYIREGSLYIFSENTVNTYNNIYGDNIGYIVCKGDRINIDTPEDFAAAEKLLATKAISTGN